MLLPDDIILLIYEFDGRWKIRFNKVIREIDLRYNHGKWWITLGYMYNNKSIKFHTMDTSIIICRQYFKFQMLLPGITKGPRQFCAIHKYCQ